jgi:hypothetical protein
MIAKKYKFELLGIRSIMIFDRDRIISLLFQIILVQLIIMIPP